jgi:predicted transcriptional regulator
LGITQEEAAQRSGIHPVEFGRVERGTRDMRLSTVTKIAAGLEVAAGELLRGLP